MRDINTGGPAFPTDLSHQVSPGVWHFEGMTLRDYFAATALPMMSDFSPELGAIEAYKWADAMLKVREQ